MYIPSLNAHDTPMLSTCLTRTLHSRQEPSNRLTKRLKGAALGVAGVLVGVLCLVSTQTSEAQLVPIKSLANKQLTDKQYHCHNEIIYRESRFNIDAVNGSHYGYYQLKSKAVIDKPYDYQFWMYWYYVASRYGITQYDEPNYCLALHHLKTKGWQ